MRLDCRKVALKFVAEHCLLADRDAEQAAHAFDQLGHIERFDDEPTLARVREQLTAELGGP